MRLVIVSIRLAVVVAVLGTVIAPVVPWGSVGALAAEDAAGLRYRVVVDGMT